VLYATAAQVLLALAANADGIGQRDALEDSVRRVLRVAADACEHFDQEQADREAALLYAAELRSLPDQATAILEAPPLPMEGGTWDRYMLAHKARTLLESEPLTAGHALHDELHATRVVACAATALLAARADRTRLHLIVDEFDLPERPIRKALGNHPPLLEHGCAVAGDVNCPDRERLSLQLKQ
jgi:hypothetical protein